MIIGKPLAIRVISMGHGHDNLQAFEGELRKQARYYMETVRGAKMQQHNFQSILLRLTGLRFEELAANNQLVLARNAVENALLRERKKARFNHHDYDLNRHIALHQAKLTLEMEVPKPTKCI